MRHQRNGTRLSAVSPTSHGHQHDAGTAPKHVDCSVNYTHELGDEAKEISGRFVVRAVPLLYGVLAGVLMEILLPACWLAGWSRSSPT